MSMADACAISSFDTYATFPSGLSTTSSGSRFAGIVPVILPRGDVYGPLVGAQRHATRAMAHRDGGDNGVGARCDDRDSVGELIADVQQRLSRARAERAREDEECSQGSGPLASRPGQWK